MGLGGPLTTCEWTGRGVSGERDRGDCEWGDRECGGVRARCAEAPTTGTERGVRGLDCVVHTKAGETATVVVVVVLVLVAVRLLMLVEVPTGPRDSSPATHINRK